jgi:carbon-monoxide dehydrogenase medium subunit
VDGRAKPGHDGKESRWWWPRASPWRREEKLKAPPFHYVQARTVAEALDALQRHGEEARVLAGGQSLVPALNMRLLEPQVLIDINRVADLRGLSPQEGGLSIGALTRHAELGRSAEIARGAPLFHRAVPFIGHAAIRNRGTLGGSLAFADPAAELPACAVALDAVLRLESRRGARRVPARDFFKGLYETALASDEIIAAVEVPALPAGTAVAFLELARRQGDYAMVGLAARATIVDGIALDPRLVFFGVGTRPIEARTAAGVVAGAPLVERRREAADALADDLDPPDDLNATGTMKRHLARVLLLRALQSLGAEA